MRKIALAVRAERRNIELMSNPPIQRACAA
jgi:hypothetical protein